MVKEATCLLSGTHFPCQPQTSAFLTHLPSQIWPKVDHDLDIYYVCVVSLECLRGGISSYNGEDAECLKKPKSRELKDVGETRVLYTPGKISPALAMNFLTQWHCFEGLAVQAKKAHSGHLSPGTPIPDLLGLST